MEIAVEEDDEFKVEISGISREFSFLKYTEERERKKEREELFFPLQFSYAKIPISA